jgi:uncharacterized protein (TIGR03067 family)
MKEDVSRLDGAWQAVRIETATGLVPDDLARRLRYTFEGARVTLHEGDAVTGAGSFAARPADAASEIDVTMTDGPGRGQTALGLYQFVRDRLRLCIGLERPAGFTPTASASLVELERAPSG